MNYRKLRYKTRAFTITKKYFEKQVPEFLSKKSTISRIADGLNFRPQAEEAKASQCFIH
jgi:hypothetical protein